MPVVNALVAVVIGFLAVVAAMRVRRELAGSLGKAWRVRFLLVQGVLINVVLFAVVCYLIGRDDVTTAAEKWAAVVMYGPLYFGYSLHNIDWTAKKFHGVEG
jgi:hypothetical protein